MRERRANVSLMPFLTLESTQKEHHGKNIHENESDLFFEILKKSLMFQANREPEKDNEVLKRKKSVGSIKM